MRINKVLASIALTGLITLGAVTNTVSADERKGNGNDGCQIGNIAGHKNHGQSNEHKIDYMTKTEWEAYLIANNITAKQMSNNEGSNGWITYHVYDSNGKQIEVVHIRFKKEETKPEGDNCISKPSIPDCDNNKPEQDNNKPECDNSNKEEHVPTTQPDDVPVDTEDVPTILPDDVPVDTDDTPTVLPDDVPVDTTDIPTILPDDVVIEPDASIDPDGFKPVEDGTANDNMMVKPDPEIPGEDFDNDMAVNPDTDQVVEDTPVTLPDDIPVDTTDTPATQPDDIPVDTTDTPVTLPDDVIIKDELEVPEDDFDNGMNVDPDNDQVVENTPVILPDDIEIKDELETPDMDFDIEMGVNPDKDMIVENTPVVLPDDVPVDTEDTPVTLPDDVPVVEDEPTALPEFDYPVDTDDVPVALPDDVIIEEKEEVNHDDLIMLLPGDFLIEEEVITEEVLDGTHNNNMIVVTPQTQVKEEVAVEEEVVTEEVLAVDTMHETLPQTGDAGISLYGLGAISAILGLIFNRKNNKK